MSEAKSPPPNWRTHISHLFRKIDIDHMKAQSNGVIDLGQYESVKDHAEAILGQVQAGAMPPGEPWNQARIDVFDAWVKAGCPK
jgi:hypothetical protein